MVQVFSLKLKKFLKNLIERNILSVMNAHMYMIEFQKRGLPYMYILILVKKNDNIPSEKLDMIVQVEILLEKNNPVFFELITKHMVYKNC